MALDFLSSDIVFPSDSTEPKLSTKSVSKLPGPVDWAFHDYLSTACEKASLPVHTLTDYAQWKKQMNEQDEEMLTLDDYKKSNNTTLQLTKQEEQIRFLVTGGKQEQQPSTAATALPPSPEATSASNLRAALCGALEHVDNAMQDNHLTRLDKYTPGSYQQNNKEFRWEDEVLFGSFKLAPDYRHGRSSQQSNDDDDDDDDMENDLFLPETTLVPSSPLSATREHFRFLDEHDDFLYERSLSTDDEGEFLNGPTLLNSSRVTSFIASSIDQPTPESPLYYPPISSAAAIVPPPPTTVAESSYSIKTTQHQLSSSPFPSTTTMEGKPTIAKSKVWQGLVGRLKKNLSKPFNNKQSQSSPSLQPRRNELSVTTPDASMHHGQPPVQGRFKRLLFKSRQN